MTLWKEPGSWVERFESTLTAATNAARRLYANPPPPDAGPNCCRGDGSPDRADDV